MSNECGQRSHDTYEMTDNQEMFDYCTQRFGMTTEDTMRFMEEMGRFDNETNEDN